MVQVVKQEEARVPGKRCGRMEGAVSGQQGVQAGWQGQKADSGKLVLALHGHFLKKKLES